MSNMGLWRVRSEDGVGQGRVVSFERLAKGLEDGIWGEADQVRGPHDQQWRLIGEHPQLEEYVPPKKLFRSRSSEEAEMDMTPMIDVTFQLLIFFMIAATYVVQKTLNMPRPDAAQQGVSSGITMEQLATENIIVRLLEDRSLTVDGESSTLDQLGVKLLAAAKQKTTAELALEASDDVDHAAVVEVLDAAAAAKIEKVHFITRGSPAAPLPSAGAD